MFITATRSIVTALTLLVGLTGCGGPSYMQDVPEPNVRRPVLLPEPHRQRVYTVRPGDSLYSIAFIVGVDWRDLAQANGIKPPFTIYPGQRLKWGGAKVASSVSRPAPSSSPRPASTPPPVATTAKRPPSLPIPAASAAAPQATQAAPTTRAATAQAPMPVAGWQWPNSGKPFMGFAGGDRPHKGIDFAGRAGDPVLAANNGSVVYAGSGVRGYGNLLIVKHDTAFLSAYAHNSKLLVKEGDVVRGGQKIAEMGDSGTDRVKLHFELRKYGSPVDPLKVLPKR